MKFLNLVFIFSFIVCIGCSKCDDSACQDHYLGVLQLNDSTKYWIPYSASSNSITFKDQNADIVQFNNSGYSYDSSSIVNFRQNGQKCDGHGSSWVYCYDKYYEKKQRYTFSSSEPSFSYELARAKDIQYPKDPKTLSPDFGDILVIKVNEKGFLLRVNDVNQQHFSDNNVVFSDSLTLGSKSFKNVYTCTLSDTTIYTQPPKQVLKVYYTLNQGLVGFYAASCCTSNSIPDKTLWVLQ